MELITREDALVTFVPIVVYWVASGIYTMLSSVEKYRLHPREEENSKNLVTRGQVIRGVILQQAVQATASLILCRARSFIRQKSFWILDLKVRRILIVIGYAGSR